MKNRSLILTIGSIFLIFLILIGYLGYRESHPKPAVLTIAIYTGSSWDVPDNQQYHMINYTIQKFQKEHPNVKIKYESGVRTSDYINWLSEQIVEGHTPDIIMMPQENFNLFASNNTFRDLTDYINRDNLNNIFYPGALASGQYAGKQYTLPYETNPTLMVANKNLLAKNGIHSLAEINNINHFRDICHQISTHNNQYGVTSSYDWHDALLAFNAPLFTGDNHELVLTDSKARQAFNLIEDLKNDAPEHNVTQEMFDQGQVAFMPLAFAQFRTYTTYPYNVNEQTNFKKEALEMPGHNSTPASTVGFGISQGCQQPNLAWEFIKLLSSDKQVQQELMKTKMGCSVMPSVIKSKKTAKILSEKASTKGSISVKTLDKVLQNEAIYPKFRSYYQIMSQLDYQIQEALDEGNIAAKLFNIQLNNNRQMK